MTLTEILALQLNVVNDILKRYTDDEAGQAEKEKFKNMTDQEKLSLLTTTIYHCSNWSDFETDLVINFDYGNY